MNKTANTTFWKYFKRNLVFQFLPFVVFSIMLSVVCFFTIRSYTVQNINTSVLNSGVSVEKILSDIDNMHFRVINNVYIRSVIQTDNFNVENKEFMNSLKETQEFMNASINMSDYIDSIYVLNKNADMIFSNYQYDTTEKFFDSAWVQAYPAGLEKPVTIFIDNGRKEYLSFIYPFNQYGANEGAIAINVGINTFRTFFKDNSNTYYIVDDNGKILFGTNGMNANDNEIIELPELEEAKVSTKFKLGRILSAYAFPDHRYILAVDMENSMYVRMNIIYQGMIVMYAVLVLLIIYFLSKKYAQYYYQNISDVIDILSVYDAESGTLNKADEFSYIKNNISQLINRNNLNEIQLSKKVLQLRESQLNALQAQINPHFILNTLNIVNLLLIKNGELHHEALKINENISKILTHVLASEEYLIPVSKEIDCTNDFLEIENIKKNNSFDVEWNVDEKLLNAEMVKFILQPIVENCIEHGFARCKDRKKHIAISIQEENKNIVFTVADNGIGMSGEKLAELREQLKKDEFPKVKNIAVLNVNRRIQLVYGVKYGLEIVSSDSEGTVIRMTIPGK